MSFSGGVTMKPLETRRKSKSFVTRASSVIVVRDLDADDFRHPLDRQNTLPLRAIPGLNEIGKALLGTVAEQVMLLENIGTSVIVSENQLGPKAEDISKPVNPFVFLGHLILDALVATYYVLVPIYMWIKDQIIPNGQPI